MTCTIQHLPILVNAFLGTGFQAHIDQFVIMTLYKILSLGLALY